LKVFTAKHSNINSGISNKTAIKTQKIPKSKTKYTTKNAKIKLEKNVFNLLTALN